MNGSDVMIRLRWFCFGAVIGAAINFLVLWRTIKSW